MKQREIQYAYDGASRLSSVTDQDGKEVVHYTYDYQNRLTAMKNQTGSAGVISEYSSEYLANGQKSKEISTIQDKEGKKTSPTHMTAITTEKR